MTGLVAQVGKVLLTGCHGEGALEGLEMHSSNSSSSRLHPKGITRDNFDAISKEDVWCLQCSIYGVDAKCRDHRNTLKNNRFRTLTLPDNNKEGSDAIKDSLAVAQQLQKILRFNTFYQPILQLQDILTSPRAQAEASLLRPLKLPNHVQQDYAGALIGMLPSHVLSTNSLSQSAPQ